MDGEIYQRRSLERMGNWRATFRHVIAQASPLDRVVCMMKNEGKGYFWKMPGMKRVEEVNLDRLQRAIDEGRLILVKGVLPRGIKVKRRYAKV